MARVLSGRNEAARGISLFTRYRHWRSTIVANPRFRRLVRRLPGMSTYGRRQAEELFSLTAGFVNAQTLYLCLETGILEALARSPLTLEDLSRHTGFAASRLEPCLRAADALAIIRRGDDGYYALGDFGAVVASDPGIAVMIRHHQDFYADLSKPLSLLRSATPETALHRFWSYAGDDRAPVSADEAASYSAVMTSSQVMVVEEVLDAYDFSRHRRIMDVGGGQGVFATACARKWPGLDVSLFDLPPVAALAAERIGKTEPGLDIKCHGGSFFEPDLPTGADCLSLIRVLFDHGDANVVRILSNCRAALGPGGTLVIAEPMAGKSSGSRIATAYFSLYLLAMGPGRCRTPDEIGNLLIQAGFASWKLRRCRSPMLASLIVAQT